MVAGIAIYIHAEGATRRVLFLWRRTVVLALDFRAKCSGSDQTHYALHIMPWQSERLHTEQNLSNAYILKH